MLFGSTSLTTVAGHSYAVLGAIEHKGKRFVRLRNPWGKTEWTGPWSDGSQEWTKEWLDALPALGHSFGNDGIFLMECEYRLPRAVSSLIFSQTKTSYPIGMSLTRPGCLTRLGSCLPNGLTSRLGLHLQLGILETFHVSRSSPRPNLSLT